MLNIITLPYQALECLEMLCTCQCRHCLPFKCNFSIFCSLNMRKTCLLCRVHEYLCILNCDAYLRRSVLHLENTSRQSRTSLHIHPFIHRSMGSAPVGVQCPLTSSLGEFLGYWACLTLCLPA